MLLLYQKRERLLIMSQVHQCYLSIALRKKSRQTAGKRVPDHQKLSMPIGVVQMDQGLISVQECRSSSEDAESVSFRLRR